jgi:hypothetical protein
MGGGSTMRQHLRQIGQNASIRVGRVLADNWILITGVVIVTIVILIGGSWDWRIFSEITYESSGGVKEVKTDRLKIIQNLGLFILALAGLGLASWRSLTAHRQANAALDQAKTALRQAEIAQSGQYVDRYAKAAQMLDSDRLAVRQAGIYALRELALVDPKNHKTLAIELLASFAKFRSSEELTKAGTQIDQKKVPTAADIVDAVMNLARAREQADISVSLESIDFISVNVLDHIDLHGIGFSRSTWYLVNSVGTKYRHCYFLAAKFEYCTFARCDFEFGWFPRTAFRSTTFRGSNLTRARFMGIELNQTTFEGCNLSGASFGDIKGPITEGFEKAWAWSDDPPTFPAGFAFPGELYDAGVDGQNRTEFLKRTSNQPKNFIDETLWRPDASCKLSQ